jgi:hypothetical protein
LTDVLKDSEDIQILFFPAVITIHRAANLKGFYLMMNLKIFQNIIYSLPVKKIHVVMKCKQ